MSPSPAAARAREVRSSPARSPARRPSLRLVQRRPRSGRLLRLLAVGLIMVALLAVVVAHSMLAEGQVRLTSQQNQLAAEQAVHRQLLATVAQAEDPSTIIAKAKQLGLAPPSSITQLPAVPLGTPLQSGSSTTTHSSTGTPTG